MPRNCPSDRDRTAYPFARAKRTNDLSAIAGNCLRKWVVDKSEHNLESKWNFNDGVGEDELVVQKVQFEFVLKEEWVDADHCIV